MRDHEGRAALWKIDLADKEDPQLIFASSRVDVRPVYTPDNRVLAVYPHSGSKDAFYVEPGAVLLGELLGKLFKDKMYYIEDMSDDMKNVVVMVESDVLAPKALAAANEPYKMVMMDDTDHYFTTQAQQRQLFNEITDFARPLLSGSPASQAAATPPAN